MSHATDISASVNFGNRTSNILKSQDPLKEELVENYQEVNAVQAIFHPLQVATNELKPYT